MKTWCAKCRKDDRFIRCKAVSPLKDTRSIDDGTKATELKVFALVQRGSCPQLSKPLALLRAGPHKTITRETITALCFGGERKI